VAADKVPFINNGCALITVIMHALVSNDGFPPYFFLYFYLFIYFFQSFSPFRGGFDQTDFL
jgi:hypothetical protein